MGYEVEWGSKAYNIASAMFSYVIPLLIMGTAYGLISGTITKKSREFRGKVTGLPLSSLRKLEEEAEETETSSTSSEPVRGQVRSHLFRKAKRKALRMSIVIVAAFIVCWTPYYVLFTCFTFMNRRQMPRRLLLALSFIGLSNSLLNPMIYGAFHLCKVHTPRSSRRKKWASFSMKSPVAGRRVIANVDSYMLPAKAERPYNVLTQKNNMLVICRCESKEGSQSNASPCLYVLYKVGQSSQNSSNAKSITSE